MTEFGKTSIISLDQFGELGYSMVIYPLSMMRVAMGAVIPALKSLKENGCVSTSLESMHTRQELYALLGYVPGEAWHFPASSR